MNRPLKNRIEVGLIRFFGKLPIAVSHFLARCFSYGIWIFKSKTRTNTEVNIKLCFPELTEQQRLKLVKQSILESVRTGLEIPIAWLEPPVKILARIKSVKGRELLDKARDNGQGIILITPHLGNWEFLGHYIGNEFQCTALFKPPKNIKLLEIMKHGRSASGINLAPTSKRGVSSLLRILKSSGMICILPDQIPDAETGYEFVDFMGQPTATMTLVSKLIQRTNAIGIACFVKRLPNASFEVIFQAADPLIYSKDLTTSLIGLNQTIEQLIKEAPAQYQWEYKRFRKGPEGPRKIY